MTDSGIEIAGYSPRYWSYDGDPTLLLCEPSQDNLFQVPGVEHQLDRIANAGGKIHRPYDVVDSSVERGVVAVRAPIPVLRIRCLRLATLRADIEIGAAELVAHLEVFTSRWFIGRNCPQTAIVDRDSS